MLGKERKYCPLSPLTTIIEVDPACRIRLRLPDMTAIPATEDRRIDDKTRADSATHRLRECSSVRKAADATYRECKMTALRIRERIREKYYGHNGLRGVSCGRRKDMTEIFCTG